jgi:hypothetical protein
MSKDKSNNWDDFIRRVRKPFEENKLVDRVIEKTLEEEKENFLFISNGDGIVIKAMHYPDSAFTDEDFPVIFKTSEDNVLIAAWPQGIIRKFIENAENTIGEKDLEKEWETIMEALSIIAAAKIRKGEINELF